MSNELIKKLSDKTAIISVVGLGYVGIPLSISFSKAGYKVVGFDIDESRRDALKKLGGEPVESIAEVAKQCRRIIFTYLALKPD